MGDPVLENNLIDFQISILSIDSNKWVSIELSLTNNDSIDYFIYNIELTLDSIVGSEHFRIKGPSEIVCNDIREEPRDEDVWAEKLGAGHSKKGEFSSSDLCDLREAAPGYYTISFAKNIDICANCEMSESCEDITFSGVTGFDLF